MKQLQKKIIRFTAYIGLLFFIYMFFKLGPGEIWSSIRQLTPANFLTLLLLRILYFGMRAFIWKIIYSQYERSPSLWKLFKSRIIAYAISYLTPSARIGGETVRVLYLKESDKKRCVASVVVDNTVSVLISLTLVFIGVCITIVMIPFPGSERFFLIGVLLLIPIIMFLLILKQRQGFFTWLIGSLKKIKLRFKFLEENREQIEETDAYISQFYQKHRLVMASVSLLYIINYLLWAFEIHITLVFLGAFNLSFLDSFLVITLGIVSFAIPTIPAQVGIYEITYISIFALLKLDVDLAIQLILIRRTLGFLLSGAGLLTFLKSKK